jgi:dolichol kinase
VQYRGVTIARLLPAGKKSAIWKAAGWCGSLIAAPLLLAGQAEALVAGHCGTNCMGSQGDAFMAHLASVVIFFTAGYVLGLLVQKRSWPVAYTRKILALTLYAAPLLTAPYWLGSIEGAWRSPVAIYVISISAALFMMCALSLTKVVRSRSPFFATVFAAIDRPEDRPFTLVWLLTSIAATWAVMVAWVLLLPQTTHYMLPALFVTGVGDALAEPVGHRFGKHTYSVGAIGTDRRYTRSLEGSACVFLSACIGIFLLSGRISRDEMVLALMLFPPLVTLAEARSPHTWDQPFMLAACGLASGGVLAVSRLADEVVQLFR